MFAPGCLALLVLFGFIFLAPFLFAQAMATALARLGLPPGIALLALLGIFLGGAINIPVKRIQQEAELVYDPFQIFGLGQIMPRLYGGWMTPFRQRVRTYMVIAVNVGGCVIPVSIALYEILRIIIGGPQMLLPLITIAGLNIAVCYAIARPVPTVGIVMPSLVPPLVAAIPALLLVPQFAPPVAFVAGVLGPLIGADLLHLREIESLQTGVVSIGGAGTFDGIVLSGMFAALLA
ncbi:MAG: DUF1614 domain-containing protein [Anaerolineae bacterium]